MLHLAINLGFVASLVVCIVLGLAVATFGSEALVRGVARRVVVL
jgi:hypothetical protein